MWRVDWDTVETETIESFAFVKDAKNGAARNSMKVGEATPVEKLTVKNEIEKDVKTEVKTEIQTEIKTEPVNDKNEVEETVKSEVGVNEVKVEGKDVESHSSATSEEVMNQPPSADNHVNDVNMTNNGHKEAGSEEQPMVVGNDTDIKQVSYLSVA